MIRPSHATATHLRAHDITNSFYGTLLANVNDGYVAMDDSYNALNGNMASSSGEGTIDALVVIAGGVAATALLALVFLQAQNDEQNDKKVDGDNDLPLKTASSSTESEASAVSQVAFALNNKSLTKDNNSSSNDSEKDIAQAMGDEMKQRPQDEFTKEEDEALNCFDDGDRVGLYGSLGRLTGKIRWTQAQLQAEQSVRKEIETKLKETAEEMHKLEDEYELGQNKLAATAKELVDTKSNLSKAQEKITVVTSNLHKLEEERKSLRKLGKVAWNLSKERLRNRVRKLRGGKGKD